MHADLHIHSLHSDGNLPAGEIIVAARKAGVNCIAITDHDSVDAYRTEDILGLSSAQAVECVRGVELSASFDGLDIHVLGYGIDTANAALLEKLQEKRTYRHERLFRMAEKLLSLGVRVDAGELEAYISGKSASRLHLAHYLQDKHVVTNIREAFRYYLGQDSPAYLPSYKDTAETAIRLIKESGGLAFAAHPRKSRLDDARLRRLAELGLDGIEALYPGCSEARVNKYAALASECGLLLSGGSDYHGDLRGEVHLGDVKVPYSWVEAIKARIASGKT